MAALRFASTSTLPFTKLTDLFNSVYEGYRHPISLTTDALARVVRVENTDLHISVVAYSTEKGFDDEPIGLGMIGVRRAVARVAAFGVAQPARGKGYAHQLMAEIVSRAKEAGAQRLMLEALDDNVAAIKVYERAGMRKERKLSIYERNVVSAVPSPQVSANLSVPVIPKLIAANFVRLHAWQPAWQRDLSQVINLQVAALIIEGDPAYPSGYAVALNLPDGSIYLYDLAAIDSEAASKLCAKVAAKSGHYRVVNEPQDSPFYEALTRHGFKVVDRQFEMGMQL